MHRHPKLIWLTCSTAEKRKVVHEINFSYSFSIQTNQQPLLAPIPICLSSLLSPFDTNRINCLSAIHDSPPICIFLWGRRPEWQILPPDMALSSPLPQWCVGLQVKTMLFWISELYIFCPYPQVILNMLNALLNPTQCHCAVPLSFGPNCKLSPSPSQCQPGDTSLSAPAHLSSDWHQTRVFPSLGGGGGADTAVSLSYDLPLSQI